MLLKRVLKHKTSFICYFEFHNLYLFTFSRLKSLLCPSSTHFAGQLAHVIGPLKCYNDDYQCYDYQYYPRFALISGFYPLIRVFLSYPRFTLSSAFYSHIRVLPSRPDIRPSIHPSVHPSVRIRVLSFPLSGPCTEKPDRSSANQTTGFSVKPDREKIRHHTKQRTPK